MTLSIVGSRGAMIGAINGFNRKYHAGYFSTRLWADAYTSALTPNVSNTNILSIQLDLVLREWGAGTRNSPHLKSVNDIQQYLLRPSTHQIIKKIAAYSLKDFNITAAHCEINGSHAHAQVFYQDIYDALHSVKNGIFSPNPRIPNIKATYPMKALLLLTGIFPAYDSQVRQGMTDGGFSGLAGVIDMPAHIGDICHKKISRIPFYVGSCFNANAALLNSAIGSSNFPQLRGDIGRLFDVLFFEQTAINLLLALAPPTYHPNWHAIP